MSATTGSSEVSIYAARMPIEVWSRCSYLSGGGLPWREADFCAAAIKKALKGDTINNNCHVVLGGSGFQLNQASRDEVAPRMAKDVATHLKKRFPKGTKLSLVPIPNTDAVVGADGPFRTLELAHEFARALTAAGLPAAAVDALRWTEAMPKASTGAGSRSAAHLRTKLKVIASKLLGTVILIDDVMTSGGHMRACESVLQGAGHKVELAICGAKAWYQQPADPIQFAKWTVPTFAESTAEVDPERVE